MIDELHQPHTDGSRIGTVNMPSASPAASEAARTLVQTRWNHTDADERRRQTEKAREKSAEVRRKKALDRRVAQLLETAPAWTDQHRAEIAAILQGGR